MCVEGLGRVEDGDSCGEEVLEEAGGAGSGTKVPFSRSCF